MDGDNTQKKERKMRAVIVVVLTVFVVAICVLIAVIVGINRGRDDEVVMIESSNDAISDSYSILNRYMNESDYSVNDAINDFEELLRGCNTDVCKIRVAISYADFMWERYENIETSIGILDRYRDIVNNVDDYAKINYYIEYSGLYTLAGDDEMSRYYADLVNEITGGNGA